mmetsp:Transcript_31760/g.48729  ORF Transcript_31760/g.48729 Transcript_31760/m.48729 type:complete len:81 (-) Transcript_31760:25-267(-)
MKNLNIDLEAFAMEGWCHGVLSFDLKIGGIPQSHKSNLLMVDFFRQLFTRGTPKGLQPEVEAPLSMSLKSPQLLKKQFGK